MDADLDDDFEFDFDFDENINRIRCPEQREARRNDPMYQKLTKLYMSMSDEGREGALRICKRMSALPAEIRNEMTDEQIYQYLNRDSGDSLN